MTQGRVAYQEVLLVPGVSRSGREENLVQQACSAAHPETTASDGGMLGGAPGDDRTGGGIDGGMLGGAPGDDGIAGGTLGGVPGVDGIAGC